MTRRYFDEHITTWEELLDLCYEHDLSACGDVYSEDEMNECLDEAIVEMAREYSWKELRDILYAVPDNTNYYYRRVGNEFEGIDNEFEDYKQAVAEEMDYDDLWDDDEDEDDEEDEE